LFIKADFAILMVFEFFLMTAAATENRNISRKDAKACPERRRRSRALSFRPKGEIFLRSLAFTRDDGPCPVTWRSWRLGDGFPDG